MAHSLFKVSSLTALLMVASTAIAQEEKDNQLDVSLQMLSHGEMRLGGFDATEHDDNDLESLFPDATVTPGGGLPARRAGTDERMPRPCRLFLQRPDGGCQTPKQHDVRLARKDVLRRQVGRQTHEDGAHRKQHARRLTLPQGIHPRRQIPGQGRIQQQRILPTTNHLS